MINLKSISYILLILLFSCNKKFNHTIPVQTIPVCQLCNYADQISGQYRGKVISPLYGYQDSLTIRMEHIFLNLGPQADSIIMYFRRVHDFDSKPTSIDTVFIRSNNGDFNPVAMKILGDSMIINRTVPTHSGPASTFYFTAKKIP